MDMCPPKPDAPQDDIDTLPGMVMVTIDIRPIPLMTFAMPVGRLVDAMDELTRHLVGASYDKVVRVTRSEFLEYHHLGDQFSLEGLAKVALWTTLNHPRIGDYMRAQLSKALAEDGNAHVTWYYRESGFALALADGYVDIERAASSPGMLKVVRPLAVSPGPTVH